MRGSRCPKTASRGCAWLVAFPPMISHRLHESPVGPLLIAASDAGVHAIEFHAPRHAVPRDARWQAGDHPLLDATAAQLDAYFAGERIAFDLPLAPEGTEFQRTVWHALAVSPDGSHVWERSNHDSGTVSVIDARTRPARRHPRARQPALGRVLHARQPRLLGFPSLWRRDGRAVSEV